MSKDCIRAHVHIYVLLNEHKMPGRYEVKFNGTGLPSGVYVYRLTAGGFAESRKMIVVR